MAFAPVAGHRTDSKLVKYLSQDRDIELWLAPVAGAHLVAPIRLSISNMLGNLVVQATRIPGHAAIAGTRATLGALVMNRARRRALTAPATRTD